MWMATLSALNCRLHIGLKLYIVDSTFCMYIKCYSHLFTYTQICFPYGVDTSTSSRHAYSCTYKHSSQRPQPYFRRFIAMYSTISIQKNICCDPVTQTCLDRCRSLSRHVWPHVSAILLAVKG